MIESFASGATASLVTRNGTKKLLIYDYYYNTSLRYIDRVGSTNMVKILLTLKYALHGQQGRVNCSNFRNYLIFI